MADRASFAARSRTLIDDVRINDRCHMPSKTTAASTHIFARAASRGVALFLGTFSAMNAIAVLAGAELGQDLWWIDLRLAPPLLASLLQIAAAFLLVAYAVRPLMPLPRRAATVAASTLLAGVALENAWGFYAAWRAGQIAPAVPVPLSVIVACMLAVVALAAWRSATAAPGAAAATRGSWKAEWSVVVAAAVMLALAFPLAQVLFFGRTDYRRPADVVVVLGARVHGNGALSASLEERVRTAVELYQDGLAGRVIMSGGVGASGIDEAAAMRDRAVELGVPASDISLDSSGVDTDATVRNTVVLFRSDGVERVLVVSQFYHLPRIKLAYRAAGIDVYTVPAESIYPIGKTPLFVAREAAGFWVYWLRGWARGLAS